MFLKYLFKGTVGYLSFLSAVISISVIFGVDSDEIANWNIIKNYWFYFILSYVLVQIVNYLLYRCRSKKKEKASKSIHDLSHQLRDVFIKRKPEEDYTGQIFISDCSDFCKNIVNFALNEYNKDVGVSIKLVEPWNLEQDEESILKKELLTLCRAGKCSNQRLENDKNTPMEHIRDNTAFKNIILCNESTNGYVDTTFACSNLHMLSIIWAISRHSPYENSHKDYLKIYSSTIVVPIRVYNTDGFFDDNECYKGYKTFGFLCIDSKDTLSRTVKEELLQFSCAFADIICMFFMKVYTSEKFKECKKTKNKNKDKK